MADADFKDHLARRGLSSGRVAELLQNRSRLVHRMGARYARCRFSNYNAQAGNQAKVKATALDYGRQIHANVAAGRGLVFFGAAGTGKDHLLAALANLCQWCGGTVEYCSGPDLFLEFRQAMKKTEAEQELVRRLVRPDVLWLSDPVPPGCRKLSDHQAASLFAVVDGRYRAQRATWVSCNVSSRDEANELLTPPIADRLRHGAVTAFFNWQSYRRGIEE